MSICTNKILQFIMSGLATKQYSYSMQEYDDCKMVSNTSLHNYWYNDMYIVIGFLNVGISKF